MEKIYNNPALNAIEICVLKDMNRDIYKFYESISDIENDLYPMSLVSSITSQNI
ncbi:hypothetical protein QIA19_05675 (plasmid) [Borreliella finlandensis]